jgi:hypothetical protein
MLTTYKYLVLRANGLIENEIIKSDKIVIELKNGTVEQLEKTKNNLELLMLNENV